MKTKRCFLKKIFAVTFIINFTFSQSMLFALPFAHAEGEATEPQAEESMEENDAEEDRQEDDGEEQEDNEEEEKEETDNEDAAKENDTEKEQEESAKETIEEDDDQIKNALSNEDEGLEAPEEILIAAERLPQEEIGLDKNVTTENAENECGDEAINEAGPEDSQELQNEEKNGSNGDCQEKNTEKDEVSMSNENDVEIINTAEASSDTGNNEIISGITEPTEEQAVSKENDTAASDKDSEEEAEGAEDTEEEKEKDLSEPEMIQNETTAVETIATKPTEENKGSEIETGDAISIANIFNDVNGNLIGENWNEVILNFYEEHSGDIDLLGEFYVLVEKSSKNNSSLDIENKNEASVKNDVTSEANTGNNKIKDGSEKDSEIETGDAYSEANIVNLVNRNFIGNNWLFATINIFSEWIGDLIVPGKDLLKVKNSSDYEVMEINNENDASIENNIEAAANTGENESTGENSGINTGDADAQVNITNVANQNMIKNNWFMLLINNMGAWSGHVLNWDEESGSYSNIYEYDFEEDPADDEDSKEIRINNENDAIIQNNVRVGANTGNNSIEGEGDSEINTGNARSFANVFNFINNNIIGDNWFFGVVNVMGSWVGNINFAYPDLTTSISDNKVAAYPEEKISYEVRIRNNGKAKAENVDVLFSLPPEVKYESDNAGSAPAKNGNDLVWNFSKLDSDEEKTFKVTVALQKDFPVGETVIESASGIKTATTEKELGNNYSADRTSVNVGPSNVRITRYSSDDDDDDHELKVSRNNEVVAVLPEGNIIKHSITVKNSSVGSIYDVEVRDRIKNDSGEEIARLTWPIGYMEKKDAVLIEYEILMGSNFGGNKFQNSAKAYGVDNSDKEFASDPAYAEIVLAFASYAAPDDSSTFLPTAEAFEANETVLGQQDDNPLQKLPLWIWLAALVSYFLAMNWALFPYQKAFYKNKEIKL